MTAESALVLPVLVVFSLALVWGLLVVAAQIQCMDAARTGARAAARQDPEASVIAAARDAAPKGATVTVTRAGGLVRVVVVAKPRALTGLPFEVREEAVAASEESVGTAGDRVGTVGDSVGTAGDSVGPAEDRVGAVGERAGAVS
ncbi:TadE family type IV pilus minor pilin [Streptomyces sp. enrichment culture]|uniref:TadE family type IV pilus minor pilin n=1 Tax=Streptomyces sp. enrichment culture TaxID=1795815 RepID=UPI003F549F70